MQHFNFRNHRGDCILWYCYYIKVLRYAAENDILQEAAFLHNLKHENIVECKGMCLSEKALMLGYATFDFGIFGKSLLLSSLDRLLCGFDECHFKEFYLLPSSLSFIDDYQFFSLISYVTMEYHEKQAHVLQVIADFAASHHDAFHKLPNLQIIGKCTIFQLLVDLTQLKHYQFSLIHVIWEKAKF